ncbi:MAG TPA: hypothetical protein VFY73_22550 [Ideonella sp.]|nr:hypothetical protein [Ideonella sp.]
MDFVFDLLARFAFKGALRALFGTPISQWGALQWGVAAALVALCSAAAYYFFLRAGEGHKRTGRKKGRKRS